MLSVIHARLVVAGLALLIAVLIGACNVVSNIPGNVAGQLMNSAGQGRGFMTVRLVDVQTGEVVAADNADDIGNFMFSGLPPADYYVKVIAVGGKEAKTDYTDKVVKLRPGKTIQLSIIVSQEMVEDTPAQ